MPIALYTWTNAEVAEARGADNLIHLAGRIRVFRVIGDILGVSPATTAVMC